VQFVEQVQPGQRRIVRVTVVEVLDPLFYLLFERGSSNRRGGSTGRPLRIIRLEEILHDARRLLGFRGLRAGASGAATDEVLKPVNSPRASVNSNRRSFAAAAPSASGMEASLVTPFPPITKLKPAAAISW